jgi:hypothetical protein
LPSIVTLVPPPLGAAVALTEAVPVALDVSFAEELALELLDLLSDEQPDSPAMTIAAPPTATTNPRFTSVLLCVCRDPSRSTDHPGKYVGLFYADMAIWRKICLYPS